MERLSGLVWLEVQGRPNAAELQRLSRLAQLERLVLTVAIDVEALGSLREALSETDVVLDPKGQMGPTP